MPFGEYERYYAVIRAIPRGQVMTYGDVARAAGLQGRARRVGYALASCRDRSVPWWRVVNAGGRVSPRDGAAEQEHRLRAEGVAMAEGAIDLARYRHVPEEKRGSGNPDPLETECR